MESMRGQIPNRVIASTMDGIRPGHALRQDSGYFDMPIEKNTDAEPANESFETQENEMSDLELQEESLGKNRHGCLPAEDMVSLSSSEHRLYIDNVDNENSDTVKSVSEDVMFHLYNDVSLEKHTRSPETHLQRDACTAYYAVSDKIYANPGNSCSSSSQNPAQFLSSLSKFTNTISNSTPLVESSKHKTATEFRTSTNSYKVAQNCQFGSQRCTKNSCIENCDRIQLQLSKLWFFVKALCTAVFLLTVAVLILLYDAHVIQCTKMGGVVVPGGVQGYNDDAQGWKTNQHMPADVSNIDKEATHFWSSHASKPQPVVGSSPKVLSPKRHFKPFDPEKDELFWLDYDVPNEDLQNDPLQDQDGRVSQYGRENTFLQSEFGLVPSVLSSAFQSLQNLRTENFGDSLSELLNDVEDQHGDKYNDDDDDNNDVFADDNGVDDIAFSGKRVHRGYQMFPITNWTSKSTSFKNRNGLSAYLQSLTPTLQRDPKKSVLIRKMRSVNPEPNEKPRGKKKKWQKGKGKKANVNKDTNRATKRSGHRRHNGKIMSETYEGIFSNHFVMHRDFLPHACRHVRRWPKQPQVCRDQLVRFQHADTPVAFFHSSEKDGISRWKKLVDFHMQSGTFRVLKSGTYFLQAHLYFEDGSERKSHWLAIFHNQKAVLACPPGGFRSSTNANGRDNQRVCQASGIVQLQTNSTLEIRTMEPNMEIVIKAEKPATFNIVRIRPT